MNEEEKKAIEYVKAQKGIYYKTVINLIDKQQKEIEARLEEINSLYKMMSAKDEIIENLKGIVNKYTREIEELKDDNNALEIMFDIANEREYRKKYIEERRKEQSNLYYPDFDEIYERYYKQKAKIEKQQKEIEELKENNKKLQDKGKELIFEKQELTSALLDSIPEDKIKEKIKEVEERRLEEGECELALHGFMREAKIEVLKELLGETNVNK